jgi:hypothetical protein
MLRVFENRVLRTIFGPKWDEVTGERRKIHNEGLHDLYSPGDKIQKNEMGGACSAVGEGRGVYSVLVGKPEGKRPLGRPRLRRENNNKMDPQEVGCGGVDWVKVAQDTDRWRAHVNAEMNFRVT